MRVIYTDCPANFDGFSAKSVGVEGYTPFGPLRRVEVDDEDFQWQFNRYRSGGVFEVSDRDTHPAFLRRIGKLTDTPTPAGGVAPCPA